MTCKDCPHFDVCKMYGALPTKRQIGSKWKNCPFRNDKAKYIELPDTVYMQGVIGTMDRSKAEAVCRDLINLGAVAAASIKNASDFDSEMSRVKWIAGATDDEFETLRKKAIQLSAGTVLSASEYAAGMAAEILHDKTLPECLNTDLGTVAGMAIEERNNEE